MSQENFTVRSCVWNGTAWSISALVPTQMRFGAPLYDKAALDAAVAAVAHQACATLRKARLAVDATASPQHAAWADELNDAIDALSRA